MPRRRPRDLHVASLMRAFARVPDPRPRGGRCHPLPAVLALATCALLDGARSLHGVAQWGRAQAPTTVATLGFICGRTPSAATLYHLFRQLDVGSLERAARAWLRSAAVPRRAVLTRGVARGQGAREDDAARVRPPPGSLVEQTTSRRRVHRRTVAPEVLAVLSMLAGAIEQYWGVSGVEGDDGTDGDRSRGVVLRLLQEDSADKTPRGASAPRVGAWTNSAPRRGEAPLPPPAPLGAPPSPKESLGRSPVWLYLAGAALAEVLIAAGEPLAGLLLHTSLAVGLLFHGANAPEQSYRHVLWGLSLGPLIRILSFSLPLTGLPLLQWYTIMLAVVLAATFVATRVLGYSRLDLGLVAPRMSVEGAVHIVSLGLVLGVVEHVVL
ncbi:MAG TPA: transposase family protein, partial [Chloroflexota bacterium]